MADLPEAVLRGHRIGPTLHSWSRDFDRATTGPTDEMMVVPGGAAAVRSLTVVGSDGVEIACLAHELQGSIDRGQADAFAVMSQIVMDLLGRSEVVPIGQDLLDCRSLPGPALST